MLRAAPAADGVAPGPLAAFLDVGSGDAVVLRASRAAVLVDGGLARDALPSGTAPAIDLGAAVVVPALAALGVARLDVVVATHGDADHAGGLASVVRAARR
ncbi:MAG: MBL fold metallo-hydrolase [Myxococcota bacterium]